jgi:hypothetical protein
MSLDEILNKPYRSLNSEEKILAKKNEDFQNFMKSASISEFEYLSGRVAKLVRDRIKNVPERPNKKHF